MKKLLGIIAIATIGLIACNNTKEGKKIVDQEVKKDTTAEQTISPALLVNKKDPICGMPTSAGVEDTISYKGKVFGFCSKECEAEFMKTPEKYFAVAELK